MASSCVLSPSSARNTTPAATNSAPIGMPRCPVHYNRHHDRRPGVVRAGVGRRAAGVRPELQRARRRRRRHRRPPRRPPRRRPVGRHATPPDTLQLVFSTTKGATAILANLLAERGELDLDAPVASATGPSSPPRARPTSRCGGCSRHQAGLPVPDRGVTLEEVLDWDPVVEKLAASMPAVGAGHAARLPRRDLRLARRRGRAPHHRASPSARSSATSSPARSASTSGSACPTSTSAGSCRSSAGSTPDRPTDLDPAMKEMLEQFMGPDTMLGRALSCHGGAAAPTATTS